MAKVPFQNLTICSKADRVLGVTAAAVAAAAGVGIVGTETNLHADVVTVFNLNHVNPGGGDFYLNLVTGVFGTPRANVPGWDLNMYGTNALNFYHQQPQAPVQRAGGGGVANLATGTLIGPASTFSTAAVTPALTTGNDAWVFNSKNLMGLIFNNEATGVTNYGWIEFTLGNSFADNRVITAYGYENAGGSLAAGVAAIPEPSTLGLLVSGAIGLLASRRRRLAA